MDPFGQREVPLTHTVTIPITAVTNPYDVTSQNAFTIIDGWLEGTVGFWDDFWGTYEYTEGVVQSRYSEWFLDTVEIDGDNFIITFAAWEEYDDDNLPPTPDFQSTTVGGVIVATLDGIGILDDRLLDDIIRSSVQRVNSWWTCDYWQVNLRWNFWRLQSRRRWRRTDTGECDTPFFGCTSPSQWRYNRSNIKWGSS